MGVPVDLVWLAGLFGLPVFAFSISLVASERYATYRTVLAMTAVLACFLVASLDRLTANIGRSPTAGFLASLLLGTAFLRAQHHVYALIAVPQGNEWKLIVDGAQQVRLTATPGRAYSRLPRGLRTFPRRRSTTTSSVRCRRTPNGCRGRCSSAPCTICIRESRTSMRGMTLPPGRNCPRINVSI